MYHEEKVINGVLHYRSKPRGEFIAYTAEQLTNQISDLKSKLSFNQTLVLSQIRKVMDKIEDSI